MADSSNREIISGSEEPGRKTGEVPIFRPGYLLLIQL
jgi:hypothetical protein